MSQADPSSTRWIAHGCRCPTLTLELSAPAEQGVNSSALPLSASLFSTMGLALGGSLFAALMPYSPPVAYLAGFAHGPASVRTPTDEAVLRIVNSRHLATRAPNVAGLRALYVDAAYAEQAARDVPLRSPREDLQARAPVSRPAVVAHPDGDLLDLLRALPIATRTSPSVARRDLDSPPVAS
ncbi:MAG: hypothetical protein M3O34_14545 [Chloroflexota bacterium]|nr:hypothetical protein [Chloroflexota bacterium]